jgi:hypothetical protein
MSKDSPPAVSEVSSLTDTGSLQDPKLEIDEHGHPTITAKYAPSQEASQLPPGAGGDGDDAIAFQESVFDDPELRKFYWPRHNYENIHRFFPDFKWTVGEEKKYRTVMVFLNYAGSSEKSTGGLLLGVV